VKLHIGTTDLDGYEFLTINTNGHQKRIRAETCQEYTNALSQGAYALTTADMATESWFRRAAGTLDFIEKARLSRHTLPGNIFEQLPVELLGWHGSDEESQIKADTSKRLTLKDYAQSGRIQNFSVTEHTANFSYGTQDFTIQELARGDWDGDGFEDALMFVARRYPEGSGRANELYVVGQRSLIPYMLSPRL